MNLLRIKKYNACATLAFLLKHSIITPKKTGNILNFPQTTHTCILWTHSICVKDPSIDEFEVQTSFLKLQLRTYKIRGKKNETVLREYFLFHCIFVTIQTLTKHKISTESLYIKPAFQKQMGVIKITGLRKIWSLLTLLILTNSEPCVCAHVHPCGRIDKIAKISLSLQLESN